MRALKLRNGGVWRIIIIVIKRGWGGARSGSILPTKPSISCHSSSATMTRPTLSSRRPLCVIEVIVGLVLCCVSRCTVSAFAFTAPLSARSTSGHRAGIISSRNGQASGSRAELQLRCDRSRSQRQLENCCQPTPGTHGNILPPVSSLSRDMGASWFAFCGVNVETCASYSNSTAVL